MGRRWKLVVAAYAITAIATFGYAAEERDNWRGKNCSMQFVISARCYTEPGAVGLTAALVWPLYWSWEIAALANRSPDQ